MYVYRETQYTHFVPEILNKAINLSETGFSIQVWQYIYFRPMVRNEKTVKHLTIPCHSKHDYGK